MTQDLRLDAGDADAGKRLDRFLLDRLPRATRPGVQSAIAGGAVRVGGAACAKGRRLAAGDRVDVRDWPEESDFRVRPDPAAPLAVVFEDASIVVLDKPGGCPSHPLRADETGTLANAVAARYPEAVEAGDSPLMAGLVHRLDAGTSGLILVARTPAAFGDLRRQFAARRVEKGYLALVRGVVAAAGAGEDWLSHDPGFRGRMSVHPTPDGARGERAMRAVTEYEPLGSAGDCTLLRVRIHTGVTHQIRCQLAARGHPVVGDAVYGPAAGATECPGRHFLHAAYLRFAHPVGGAPMAFRCRLPADLRRVLGAMDESLAARSDTAWA